MKFSSFRFALIALASLGLFESGLAQTYQRKDVHSAARVARVPEQITEAERSNVALVHKEFKKDVVNYLVNKDDNTSKTNVIDDLEEIGRYVSADGKRATVNAVRLTEGCSSHSCDTKALADSYEKVLEAISSKFGPGIVDNSKGADDARSE